MSKSPSSFRFYMELICARLGLDMRAKLILLFVIIKVVPLVLLALIAWKQTVDLGAEMRLRTTEISAKANKALSETGEIAVSDAVDALDARATEGIERITTDTAQLVANFLYARDGDMLVAASLEPSADAYAAFINSKTGRLVAQGEWVLAENGKLWQRADLTAPARRILSSNEENDHSFNYRPPEQYQYRTEPLYREMTFVGLDGMEKLKITSSSLMSDELRNVADRRNTFCGAEDYFAELKNLKPGEIYVSDVIGEYVGTNLIGMYTPENCAKLGVPYEPEKQAWSGKENPRGKRFDGIVRWAAPVVQNGKIIGYVTLALNHDHLMAFTDHIVPTQDRYVEIPSAAEGNYAFIWDYNGRSIVHPRHYSIAGYDPKTGNPQVPWLEDRIYDEWQASGKSYVDFIEDVPTFFEQSNSKKPAAELTRNGLVALDCRYLNFAPQCTGWFDLTKDGGSGSFLILWSGLWKLNTAAAIPYYTGKYGKSPRGFGFVAVGAGVVDFHRPATDMQEVLKTLVDHTDADLDRISSDAHQAITDNLWEMAANLTFSTLIMVAAVIMVAIWLASAFTRSIVHLVQGISRFRSGERHFRFNAPIKDELGLLADSFDDMADSIVSTVKGPLSITTLDRKICYMNAEALLLAGKELNEVLGKPYAENSIFVQGSPYCPITALLSDREAEVLFHRTTGHYYKGKASYLTNSSGQNIGYIVSTSDVTDLISEQKRIEQQRALLDTVFSSSPDLIWYEDVDGRYLAANPRFTSLLGKSFEEVRGRAVHEVMPPHVAKSMQNNDSMAIENAMPLYTEERFTFADGHEETLDVVRTPLFNQQGAFVGLLGVARDVSQRVQAENELRHTQMELKKTAAAANRANDSKSAFLARMSHEIRTPMNAIIGMTNITKRKLTCNSSSTEEVLGHVRQIESSSAHLLGVLNDILDISKIEAGKIELSEESFEMSRLTSGVAAIIRPRCAEKNIDFSVQLEDIEASRFVADALRLRQVLINLLGNAVKFTPDNGKIALVVRQLARKDSKTLVGFSVADNGIGISSEGLETLFTPFEQGGSHITRNYGGTGLGLSISRSIVILLGGDITVKTEEGKGSEFSFAIWLAEDSDQEAREDRAEDVSMLPGKRVLLVDDVDINRIIVMEHLSHTGLVIDEAGDGIEAVRKFTDSPVGGYDIIFMDVQMPIMDGYEASEKIRALERPDAKTIPIVAMTANAFKEDVDMAFARGMNGHLAKPLEIDKMMEVLVTLLAPYGLSG